MNTKFNRFALALIATGAVSVAIAGSGTHWSYDGKEGPAHWGELSKEYGTCGTGHLQSPINIAGAKKAKLQKIKFSYKPSPLSIVNNGHTIQVNIAEGSSIKLGDHSFKLLQFHMHTPSEEQVDGKPYDMVAHLVHKDDQGHLTVVAVLLKAGKENKELAPVFANMPAAPGEVVVKGVTINVKKLLPRSKTYYSFDGSLTTPPCSEGVKWLVLKQPGEIAAAQLDQFKKRYPHNARPIQPTHGREILVSG